MNTKDALGLLFAQLTWPSGMVRERACVAIADLLLYPQHSAETQTALLDWMREQTLESVMVHGLLALLRAKIQDSNFVFPHVDDLVRNAQKPSILSWMLIKEMHPDADIVFEQVLNHSEKAPPAFQPDPFFDKYITTFLPPIYADRAAEIEKKELVRFRRQWAYEWQCLVAATGIKPSRTPMDFWMRDRSDYCLALDLFMGEIYRSAYLRALAWAATQGRLSQADAVFFASQTCPIDLAIWRIKPERRPVWWPQTTGALDKIDTVPAQIWQQVQALWDRQRTQGDEWVIAAASGIVHEEEEAAYDLEIFGLFQKCHGPETPDFSEVAAWCRYGNGFYPETVSPLHFDGRIPQRRLDTAVKAFADWSFAPAANTARNVTVPRWQWWRMNREIWVPSAYIDNGPLTFRCQENGITVRNDKDYMVAEWSDWTDSLQERCADNVPPATGQFLRVARKQIERFAAETGSTFCWVCRLTGYHSKSYNKEWERAVTCREFGVSRIVRD